MSTENLHFYHPIGRIGVDGLDSPDTIFMRGAYADDRYPNCDPGPG